MSVVAGAAAQTTVARAICTPLRSLDEVRSQLPPGTVLEPGRVSLISSYFEVAGRLRLEDRVLEERSLLVRRDNQVQVLRRERQSFTTAGR